MFPARDTSETPCGFYRRALYREYKSRERVNARLFAMAGFVFTKQRRTRHMRIIINQDLPGEASFFHPLLPPESGFKESVVPRARS